LLSAVLYPITAATGAKVHLPSSFQQAISDATQSFSAFLYISEKTGTCASSSRKRNDLADAQDWESAAPL